MSSRVIKDAKIETIKEIIESVVRIQDNDTASSIRAVLYEELMIKIQRINGLADNKEIEA